jgi:hypothetical protein
MCRASMQWLQVVTDKSINTIASSQYSGNECPPNSRVLFGVTVMLHKLRVIVPRVRTDVDHCSIIIAEWKTVLTSGIEQREQGE